MNIDVFKYVLKLALHYRLSLKELCELMGRETNKEEQMKLYNQIVEFTWKDMSTINAYKFLFNYDSVNKKDDDVSGYNKARARLTKYIISLKLNKTEEILKLEEELNQLDEQVKRIKYKKDRDVLTLEEAIIISKYRVKYGLSREKTAEMLGVNESTLRKKEQIIQDEKLKHSLNALGIYYTDLTYKKWKK